MLNHVKLILGKFQRTAHRLVAFYKFRGGKPRRDVNPLCVVFHHMRNRMNRTVHRSGAEVLPHWQPTLPRRRQCNINQFANALVSACADRHDWHANLLLKLLELHSAAVRPDLIHHIERNHHRNIQLNKLKAKIEIPLNIRCIHDVDDAVRMSVQQEIPRDDLFVCIG